MNKALRALLEKKTAAVQRMRAIADAGTDRELTAEENTEFDALSAQVETLNASIAREQSLIEQERTVAALPVPRVDDAGTVRTTSRVEVSDNRANDPSRGFATFGEFARSVHAAAMPGS